MTETKQPDHCLSECMGRMFDNQRRCDIRFRCSDQTTAGTDDLVQAHKMVLAARSPVFEAMFYGPCADNSAEVLLTDIQSQPLKVFLRYLYTDQADLKEDTISEVMLAAHKYQVMGLYQECNQHLSQNIHVDNACSIVSLADFFGDKRLADQAMQFIDDNAERVLMTDGFLEFQLTMLMKVLAGDTFCADEKNIIKASIKWAERQCQLKSVELTGSNIRDALGDAFKYLRFPCLTAEEFSQLTFRKGYFSTEEIESTFRYITCDKTVQTVNVARKRQPRYGSDKLGVHPLEGRQTDVQSSVTSRIRVKCKKEVLCTSLVLSTQIQHKTVQGAVVLQPKHRIDVYLEPTNLGTSRIALGRYTAVVGKPSHLIFLKDQLAGLRKLKDFDLIVQVHMLGNVELKIPCVKNVLHASFVPKTTPLEVIFLDKYRIVDSIRYECPSGRNVLD